MGPVLLLSANKDRQNRLMYVEVIASQMSVFFGGHGVAGLEMRPCGLSRNRHVILRQGGVRNHTFVDV